MTITYALSRGEIVRVFLAGLVRSPRILTVVLALGAFPAAVSLASAGAFSGAVKSADVVIALLWFMIGFCFVLAIVFARAKTEERTLSVSEQGISTRIGSLTGQRPWSKVKEIKDAGSHILIVGISGNAFFIPSRAFSGSDQRKEFLSAIRGWHRSA